MKINANERNQIIKTQNNLGLAKPNQPDIEIEPIEQQSWSNKTKPIQPDIEIEPIEQQSSPN